MNSTTWDTISFDCYGTLVDWETGITSAFENAAAVRRREIRSEAIIPAYHEVEPEVQAGPYRPYREVLREVAVRVAERLAWRLEPEDAGFLADSLPEWPVFSDTGAGLRRLGKKYRLAILSNIDNDLLGATIERIDVGFDWTVTAEDLQSYKPNLAHFRAALRRVGGDPSRLLHAAQSRFHDIEPASRLGLATVWVNRQTEDVDSEVRPLHSVTTITELAEWLGV